MVKNPLLDTCDGKYGTRESATRRLVTAESEVGLRDDPIGRVNRRGMAGCLCHSSLAGWDVPLEAIYENQR